MRAIFIAVFLMLCNVPAWASMVYFCAMDEVASIEKGELSRFKLENFKMAVTETEITFGSGGYFNNSRATPNFWAGDDYWQAEADFALYAFDAPHLTFAQVINAEVISVYATCDRF